jgi:hypothetical protein
MAALLSTVALHAEESPENPPPYKRQEEESTQKNVVESDGSHLETRLLMISATVYDRSLTKLRWWYEGREYEAVSNIDFNYMRPASYFKGSSAFYFLLMGIGNENSAQTARRNRVIGGKAMVEELPSHLSFPQGKSSYLVTGERVGDTAAYKLLDELHQYFDQNKESLIATYNQWEEENRQLEAWLKANPPKKEKANTGVWLRAGAADYSKSSTR